MDCIFTDLVCINLLFVCVLLYIMLPHSYLICVFYSPLCSNYWFCVLYCSLYIFLLVLYPLFSILCVLCFCIIMSFVSPHVYNCFFSICVQVNWLLPPGGNPVAVNEYHIISVAHYLNHRVNKKQSKVTGFSIPGV